MICMRVEQVRSHQEDVVAWAGASITGSTLGRLDIYIQHISLFKVIWAAHLSSCDECHIGWNAARTGDVFCMADNADRHFANSQLPRYHTYTQHWHMDSFNNTLSNINQNKDTRSQENAALVIVFSWGLSFQWDYTSTTPLKNQERCNWINLFLMFLCTVSLFITRRTIKDCSDAL